MVSKEEGRILIQTKYKDTRTECGLRRRIFFDDDMTQAVHARNIAWEDAKRVLGDSHAIFNKFNNKKTPISASHANLTAIKKLADVMKLTRWRQVPECANLLYLTDEQRAEVIVALDTLHKSLQMWGKAQRTSFEANQALL